jgi:hypothetical protein
VILRTWRLHVQNLLVVVGAAIGALPWLWRSVTSDWSTLEQYSGPPLSYGDRLWGCVSQLYPLLLGLRRPITQQWVGGDVLGPLLYVLLAGSMLAVAVWRLRARAAVVVVPIVLYPFIYAVSSTSWYWAEPRHGMFVAPFLILLAAALVPPRWPVQLATGVLLLAVTVSTVSWLQDLGEKNTWTATLVPGRLAPVLDELRAREASTCYADYWIAYRVAFESDRAIVCQALQFDRHPPYRVVVAEARTVTWLFLRDTLADRAFAATLAANDIGHETVEFERFTMYVLDEPANPFDLDPCITPDGVDEAICFR